jgi:hypothetical protein
MKGIYEQSEYITQYFRFTLGQFWDPGREIRTTIQDNLAMLSRREVDIQTLLANGEMARQASRARDRLGATRRKR